MPAPGWVCSARPATAHSRCFNAGARSYLHHGRPQRTPGQHGALPLGYFQELGEAALRRAARNSQSVWDLRLPPPGRPPGFLPDSKRGHSSHEGLAFPRLYPSITADPISYPHRQPTEARPPPPRVIIMAVWLSRNPTVPPHSPSINEPNGLCPPDSPKDTRHLWDACGDGCTPCQHPAS